MSSSSNGTFTTVASILGLTAALYAYQQCSAPEEVKENFLPGMQARRIQVAQPQDAPKGDFYEIPGTYQQSLSPSGGAGMVDYGANIRYNMPANNKLRTPKYNNVQLPENKSLNYADMVYQKEGYCGSCSGGGGSGVESYCGPSCNQAKMGCNASSGSGSSAALGQGPSRLARPSQVNAGPSAQFKKEYNQLAYNETTDLLPVMDMSQQSVGVLGDETINPIIYDRFIYANQKRRGLGQGDFFRGDLPIVPNNTGWFQPSADPQLDLRTGALAVMGGIDNGTSNELMALQTSASGGLLSVGGGINYGVQKLSRNSMGGADLVVTSFP